MIDYTVGCGDLDVAYRQLGIPTDTPGFYDHPAFVRIEQRDPMFLNTYARYVQTRTYTRDYLARAEDVIRVASEALFSALVHDGRLGACIDASMVLSRVLEREGVWNFITKGVLTVTFPTSDPEDTLYFWPIDEQSAASAAHVWLYAPPFVIVDVTISRQPFESSLRPYLTRPIYESVLRPTTVKVEDICSPGARIEALRQGFYGERVIYGYEPELRRFFRIFPANEVNTGGVRLKYVPCGIGAPAEPLEAIRSLQLSGRTGMQIYEEDILPKLSRLQS